MLKRPKHTHTCRSLRTRKAPTPSKFFTSGNPFITEFEFGQLKELWTRLSQNEISFTFYYAPWDADCIRARNEIETAANHYGQQIFFGAINCWWPEGECRKYQNIRRYPRLVAHIRSEGEVLYKGPLLASYIIPFLDNVMNPLMPIQNEGELLDLRAKHDVSRCVVCLFRFCGDKILFVYLLLLLLRPSSSAISTLPSRRTPPATTPT